MGAVLLSTGTIDTTLRLVTALAVQSIPGTTGAGVTVMDSRGVRSPAASNPLVEQANALQYRLDAGPCLPAASKQVTVRSMTSPPTTDGPPGRSDSSAPINPASGVPSRHSADTPEEHVNVHAGLHHRPARHVGGQRHPCACTEAAGGSAPEHKTPTAPAQRPLPTTAQSDAWQHRRLQARRACHFA
jgi:hypothetical protein